MRLIRPHSGLEAGLSRVLGFRSRLLGQGCRTLAGGSQRATIRPIRRHGTAAFWLRRASARRQCQIAWYANDVIRRELVGTAWYAK